jgi:hypothetical protein
VDLVASGALGPIDSDFACYGASGIFAGQSVTGTYAVELRGENPGQLTLHVEIDVTTVGGIPSSGTAVQDVAVDAADQFSAPTTGATYTLTVSGSIANGPRLKLSESGTVTLNGVAVPAQCTGDVALFPH